MPIEMSRYMSRELLEPPEPEDHADAALPAPSPAAAPVATPATAAPAPTNEPPASLLMRLPAAPLAPAYVVAGGPRARSILDDLGEPALRRPIAAPAAANDASIVAPTPPAAPPAAAPYVGERPVDAAWLAERETALKGVRADYEAQRAAAQASTGTGPGWIPATLVTDESGQTRSASGAPTVFIADPGAAPQLIGWNESSPVYGAPAGRTLEFNEEAFAASYRAQAGAPLQTLAHSYGTDAATLLAQHPGLWTLATQDHALNAGPAPAGRAMGDAGQLAMLDLYMADPQIAGLIQRYGSNVAPATSGIAQEQVRIYGQARYEQLTRLGNAMQAVRNEYGAAMQRAEQSGGGPGWVEHARTVTISDEGGATHTEPMVVRDESGAPMRGADGQPIAVMERVFDPDTFTAWYVRQDGMANQAFASFYGRSHTQWGSDESGASVAGSVTFDNPNWTMGGAGGGMGHTSLVSIDPNNAPRLNNDGAVGFDLEAGWATHSSNIHQSHDWFETVVQVAIVAAVSYVSAGTLGAAAAGAVGYGTAGAVASAAVVGATASVVSGAMNGNLTFKGVLQGALSGALTAGLMGSLGGTVSEIAGPAGTIALRTTVQGGINALLGGSFRDGAIAGLATDLAEQAGASINKGIDDAVAKGTMSASEAIAARTMARVFSSAVRALGNPNDPQYAFASDLVNGVVNDGLAAAGEPGTGVGAQPAASPDAGLALPDPTLSLNSELDDLANGPPDLLADAGGGIPAPAAQRSTARALLDNIEQQIGYRLSPEQRMRTLEFVLGLLPITGEATSIYELVMGKSPLSGDEASRWIAAIGVVTGGYGADAVKGLRVATLERAVQRHIGEVEALAAREGLPVVRESSGTKGAWSEALNGELKPGTVYILESGHTYVTDALGRVSKAEGVLDLLKVDRNTYQQIMAGKIGGEGYDGGHLLATLFGGAGEKVNLIPQLSAVNRGEFREMERTWADAIREGKSVKVEVSPIYADGGKVPNEVVARWWIDGKPHEKTFPNIPVGG